MSFIIYSINANKIPFYIGRTGDLKRRKYEHLSDKSKTYKANKIRKCVRLGIPLNFVILHEVMCFRQSIDLEIREIKQYKQQGFKLTNRTEGGEGQYGVKRTFTEQWKSNLKQAKQRLFENGYVQFNKGKTLDELIGPVKAAAQKIRIGNKIKQGRQNGSMTTTKGRTLEQMVGKDRADQLKTEFSERAKTTFTGTKQTQEHIEARITNQKLTKANWTEEQREQVRNINRTNSANSIKRYNFLINDSFSHYGTWKSLSLALKEELGIKAFAQSLSKFYKGEYKTLDCGITKIDMIN
jgi:predicted GIY-YIG superfamily endonuclease